MDIFLSPSNEKFLQSQVAAGIYDSINEALNATLSLAISQVSVSPEEINSLKAEISKGIEDMKAGRVCDGIAFMDELIAEDEQV